MVAILGAGPIGAAIAHKLADRARVRGDQVSSTRMRPSPRARRSTSASPDRLTASTRGCRRRGDVLAATGADVIVVADRADGSEWEGERGLALVGRLGRAGTRRRIRFRRPEADVVDRGGRARAEGAGRPADRHGAIGPGRRGAARSPASSSVSAGVNVTVGGRPPSFVIGWSSATVGGALVTDRSRRTACSGFRARCRSSGRPARKQSPRRRRSPSKR